MPPRTFPTTNASLDFDRAIDGLVSRISALEAGRHRGPGSSFGAPFRITNGVATWALSIDASGNLTATNETTGTVTTLALA